MLNILNVTKCTPTLIQRLVSVFANVILNDGEESRENTEILRSLRSLRMTKVIKLRRKENKNYVKNYRK